MKRTAACLAGLLMLVLLADCKGGADESGARENKGDIETSGTVCQKPFSMRPMTDFI